MKTSPRAARWSVGVVLVAGLAAVPGCPGANGFGRPCADHVDCPGDAPVCVDERCVPRRTDADAGARCDRPARLPALDLAADGVTLRVASMLGDVGPPDPAPSCAPAGARTVAFAFSVPRAVGVRFAVQADPDDAFAVGLEVRSRDEGACGDSLGCAQADGPTGTATVTVPRVEPGVELAVLVHGAPAAGSPGRFVLTATRLECPLGYDEADDDSCIGVRLVPPLPARLDAPQAAAVGGRAVVVGGESDARDAQEGQVRGTVHLFDPLESRWSRLNLARGSLVALGVGELEDGTGFIANGYQVNTAGTDRFWRLRPDTVPESAGLERLRPGPGGPPSLYGTPVFLAAPGGVVLVGPGGNQIRCELDLSASAAAIGCQGESLVPTLSSLRVIAVRASTPRLGFFHGLQGEDGGSRVRAGFFVLREQADDDPLIGDVAVAPRQGVALVDDGDGVLIVGGEDGEQPSTLVEYAVPTSLDVQQWPPLPHRLRGAVAFRFAGRPWVAGGCQDVACAASSPGTYRLAVDAVTPGPALPLPGDDLIAVPIDDDRVLFLDIVGRAAALLERVPRGFVAAPPADERDACPFDRGQPPLVLQGEPRTLRAVADGGRDLLRTSTCGVGTDGDRTDAVYAFEVTTVADVAVTLTPTDPSTRRSFGVWTFVGGCGEDRVDLGCAEEDPGAQAVLRLPAVPAGLLYVVVEVSPSADAPFFPFSLHVEATPVPEVCAPDVADPADDEPGAARAAPIAADFAAVDGTLCSGDVDHVRFEHGAGSLYVWSTGVTDGAEVSLQRVPSPDDPGPAAPLVASSPLTEFADLPTGAYVVRLAGSGSSTTSLPWRLALQSTCSLDEQDSLQAALDDSQQPVGPAPPPLAPREARSVRRTLCFPGDVDIVPLPDWRGGRLEIGIVVSSNDAAELPVTLHAVDADGGLGAALPASSAFGELVAVGAPDEGRTALRVGPANDLEYSVVLTISVSGQGVVDDGSGESCGAPLRPAGPAGSLTVQLADRVDDLDANDIGGCTGYASDGPDAFLRFEVPADATLAVTATPRNPEADVALYAFAGCPPAFDACVAGSDVQTAGLAEDLAVPPASTARTLFVAVDQYNDEAGAVDVTWRLTP